MSIVDPPELRLTDTDFGRPSKSKTTSRSAANNGLRPNINAVITNTEQGEEEEEGDVDVAPRRAGFFHLVVKYYWIAFGTVLCLELLAVLLSAIFSINNKLFPLDFMQVPVEIKTEKTYIRDLAFELRLQDPHLIIPEDEKKFYLPYAQAVDDLSLIYRGDNVLTKECLQAIRDVELWMTNSTVWQNYGLTDNVGNVLKPDSIIRFFDGTHRTDLNDTEFRDIPNTLFRAYSDRQLKATLQTFLAKDAVISSTVARSGLTRSVFILGVARTPDYRLKTFWKNNFGEKLKNLAKNGRAGMTIFFYTHSIFYDDIGQQVKCDSSLAWGSMLFVLLFVFLQTQSIFITTMGMASIGFSFLWANYIYRVVLDYRGLWIMSRTLLWIFWQDQLEMKSQDIWVSSKKKLKVRGLNTRK